MSTTIIEKPFLPSGTTTQSEVEELLRKKEVFEKKLNGMVANFERDNDCKYSLKIEEGKITGLILIEG